MGNNTIVLNTGWCREYCGDPTDPPLGKFGYFDLRPGHGHEACNFLPWRGSLYGYSACGSIDLKRLGGDKHDEYMDGVTVIWVSRNPQGRVYVVGWYANARVYHNIQQAPRTSNRKFKDDWCAYFARADVKNCRLLRPEERTLIVPTGKGALGQKPVWYCDTTVGSRFLKKVEKFMSTGSSTKTASKEKKGHPRQPNTAKRQAVENAAMNAVSDYYAEKLHYKVSDVSDKCKGWDLEAVRDDVKLLVEVKGLSGNSISVELTPNEFAKMKGRATRENYRIAVVRNALTRPVIDIFAYAKKGKEQKLVCENRAAALDVTERIGARLVEL